MIGRRWAGRLLRPRQIRTRIAMAILASMVLSAIGILWMVGSTVEANTKAVIERGLTTQATAIARRINREDPRNAAQSAREAQRYIGDLRMVVWVSGEVVHYNVPEGEVEARGVGSDGEVRVQLERPDPTSAAVEDWVIVVLVVSGIAFVALVVWLASGTVARQMARAVADVADSAEAVTAGRFDVRIAESDDEIGRLARSFNRMTSRLGAADAHQREFLADVAHELRTPVTAIEGFASALDDGTARSDEDRAESISFIRDEAARLRELVRDLQSLTWLDLNPTSAAEPVDLAEMARLIVARIGPDARGRGVELTSFLTPHWAIGDAEHIQTILGNLVANALAATPPGGSIRLEAMSVPNRAGLCVTDTGCGIEPEHLPYLFDRLYRVDRGRDRGPDAIGGSGLGLAIVRRLATLQNGTITVESRPGRGSRFTLWLPAHTVPVERRSIRRTGSGKRPVEGAR